MGSSGSFGREVIKETKLNLSEYDPNEVKRAAKIALYNQDLDLFCRKEVKIVTKEMGLRPLVPYEWQAEFLEAAEKQLKKTGKIRQIWFKCRQPGGSTLAAAIISRLFDLNHNVHAFTVAQDKTTVANLFDIYNSIYENLSPEIKPMRQYFQKGTEIVLGNPSVRLRTDDPGLNSRLQVGEAKNIHVGTGFTIHALHLSELSRYPTVYPVKDSLIPAFSDGPGTIGIIESTAHWAAGSEMMKSLCEKARAKEGNWEYHFLKWWLQPEYKIPIAKGEVFKPTSEERHLLRSVPRLTIENLKWMRKKIEDMDGDIYTFRSNYPFTFEEAWVPVGHSAFSIERLMELKPLLRPPKRRCEVVDGEIFDSEDGRLSIWFEPEKGKEYDIGADFGSGMEDVENGDFTTAEVIERGTNKQVAEWRGQMLPGDFGDILYHLGKYYNWAQVAPEVEAYGLAGLLRLQELCYPNIHIWLKDRDKITPKYTTSQGWATNRNSKLIIVYLAQHLLWNRGFQIFSEVLWNEMMNFVKDSTPTGLHTYRAAPGTNDDCLTAFMIALQISKDEWAYRVMGEMESKQQKTDEKYNLEPAHYDAEGLKSIGTHSSVDEMAGW